MLIVEFTKSTILYILFYCTTKTPKNGDERYLNRKNRDDEEGERGLREATKGLLGVVQYYVVVLIVSSKQQHTVESVMQIKLPDTEESGRMRKILDETRQRTEMRGQRKKLFIFGFLGWLQLP